MDINNSNKKVCSFNTFLLYIILFVLLSSVLNLLETRDIIGRGLLDFQAIWVIILVLSVVVCYFYNAGLAWKDIKINKSNIVKVLIGPWMFIPQIFLGTFTILSIYQRPMETGVFDKFLFFQGSIDMGCELIFVATIALYVLFGFIASWYAVLKLEELDNKSTFLQMFTYLVKVLKYHIAIFIFWGILCDCDARIIPNDFRNMFLLVFFLYLFTMILIVIMRKLNLSRGIRLIIAPIFIVIWLIIGSDGNTARAKQIPIWNDNPHYVVTSKKHAIMIAWHNLCDDFFGDPKPHYTHQYPH